MGRYHDACGSIPCTMYTEGYHKYLMGDIIMHVGDIKSTSGNIMMHVRRYYEYIGGCSVHRGFQYKLKRFYQLAPPHAS